MTTSELITLHHLSRKAVIYIRQSTPHQALSHQEHLLPDFRGMVSGKASIYGR